MLRGNIQGYMVGIYGVWVLGWGFDFSYLAVWRSG